MPAAIFWRYSAVADVTEGEKCSYRRAPRELGRRATVSLRVAQQQIDPRRAEIVPAPSPLRMGMPFLQ